MGHSFTQDQAYEIKETLERIGDDTKYFEVQIIPRICTEDKDVNTSIKFERGIVITNRGQYIEYKLKPR